MVTKERILVITWPELGISVECKPLSHNREIYDWYLDHCPIRGVQSHGVCSGPVAYVHNFILPERRPPAQSAKNLKPELLTEAPIGRVKLTPAGAKVHSAGLVGGFSVKYGELTEDMSVFYCAQVVEEDIDKLKKAGAAIWNAIYKTKEIITVELSEKK